MNLQRVVAAPIVFGLIIFSFPLLSADAKDINLSDTSFTIAMDAEQETEDGESNEENQDSEVSENEGESSDNQTSETPENEESSDSETTVEEEPAEVNKESQPSKKCLINMDINVASIMSLSKCVKNPIHQKTPLL
ncbi:MAG: hypothetical protein AAFR37_16970 [Cyanobacteria bacterium J06628_3]